MQHVLSHLDAMLDRVPTYMSPWGGGKGGPPSWVQPHSLSGPPPLQVSVMWSTIPGSATAGSDYYPTSGSVTFQQGDVLVPAGLTIVDDNIPEFNESLTVVLTSASGGAMLGTVLEATVLILANDDPNGALGELGVLGYCGKECYTLH